MELCESCTADSVNTATYDSFLVTFKVRICHEFLDSYRKKSVHRNNTSKASTTRRIGMKER